MRAKTNLIGQRFGMLIVDEQYWTSGEKYCLCICDCGLRTKVRAADLVGGNTKSCGCLRVIQGIANGQARKKHGLSGTPEYDAWSNIKDRCLNPNCIDFRLYGGRGIKVCWGWMDFSNFYNDNGAKPSPELSIDRINNDGHYSCGHCEECHANNWPMNTRWTTASQQRHNQNVNDNSIYRRKSYGF